jgi:hypothetical protein
MLLSNIAKIGTLGLVTKAGAWGFEAGTKAIAAYTAPYTNSLAAECGKSLGQALHDSFSPAYKSCVQQASQLLPNLPPFAADALCLSNHIPENPAKAVMDKIPSIMDRLPTKCKLLFNTEAKKLEHQVEFLADLHEQAQQVHEQAQEVIENIVTDPKKVDFAKAALQGFTQAREESLAGHKFEFQPKASSSEKTHPAPQVASANQAHETHASLPKPVHEDEL